MFKLHLATTIKPATTSDQSRNIRSKAHLRSLRYTYSSHIEKLSLLIGEIDVPITYYMTSYLPGQAHKRGNQIRASNQPMPIYGVLRAGHTLHDSYRQI